MAGFLRGVPQATLSFGGVTATITDIQVGGYSRPPKPGQNDQVESNLNNNTVVSGSRSQVDYEWDLTFYASESTVLDLEDIHLLSKASPVAECQFTDLFTEVMDSGTLTRLVAPAPKNTITTRASGNKHYFAVFNVIIVEINTRSRSLGTDPTGQKLWEVNLSLEEASPTA